jgi:hypothetical protein
MTQPDLIPIHPTLRLRQASLDDAQIALLWYQDLENLRLSEGEAVTQSYSIETVKSMYKFLIICRFAFQTFLILECSDARFQTAQRE